MSPLDIDIAIDAFMEQRPNAKAELIRMLCLHTPCSLHLAEVIADGIERAAAEGVRIPAALILGPLHPDRAIDFDATIRLAKMGSLRNKGPG